MLSAYCVPFTLLFIVAFSLSLTATLGGPGGLGIFSDRAAWIESVSKWAEATALGSGRCRSQAWQGHPLWKEPIQLHISMSMCFLCSPVLWCDSRQVPYVPVTLFPKRIATVSLVLLLESLTRCSCVGPPGLCLITSVWDIEGM